MNNKILERFKKAGLPPNAGRLNPLQQKNSAGLPHPSTVANKRVYETLQKIKSGAKKNEFKEIFEKTKNRSGVNGFQIPEVKMKKRKDPQNKSTIDVKVDNFKKTASFEEGEMLEKMFSGDDTPYYENNGKPNLSIDNMGDYDINSELRNRLQKKAESQQENLTHQNIDSDSLQQMMFNIAKEVAEDTVKKIIKQFIEENRKKKNLEFYNKSKQIVKVNDKLYKLVPVKIKDH